MISPDIPPAVIGAALCLGFHLKDYFLVLFASAGFSDFRKRWHISLSTFLRDHLYIPLGGNRVGAVRAALNLILVMFIGGLWHRAAWAFGFAPPAAPPYQNGVKALKRYQTRNLSQRAGHHLGMFLEEKLAFMKQEDLVLPELVRKIPVPNRANSHLPPNPPPYFQTIDRERRTRMADQCVRPGPLQDRVKTGWIPLFTPPKFPDYTPKEVLEGIAKSVEARFGDTVAAVNRIRAHGRRVVFVRFLVSGELKELEEKLPPRTGPWTRLMKETGAPNIYYSDHPELIFDCPEWSHLSGPDSEEFTKRLVPHLKRALATPPDSRG